MTYRGRPVPDAWVSLHRHRTGSENRVNVDLQRGRTSPNEEDSSPFKTISAKDGHYRLDVPYQDSWYLIAEEPGGACTIVGPKNIERNQHLDVDLEIPESGSIQGRLANVPKGMAGQLWVIAFDRTLHRAEARVSIDGTFRITHLPPGEYGLKAGHDGYQDPEVPCGENIPKELFEQAAKPWHAAVIVRVGSAQKVTGINVACPETFDARRTE